jgi:prolyl oligopeptidase
MARYALRKPRHAIRRGGNEDWRAYPMRLAPLVFALLMASPAFAGLPPEKLTYPQTRVTDVAEVQFGEKVADPYRWLENDVRNDSEVRTWVEAQNKLSSAYLAALPGRDIFAARLKQLFSYERFGVPRKGGNRYFYTRNNGLQNQSALWVRDGLKGTPRVLIDPNGWAKDGATALAEWQQSHDGRYLLYAVQDGGTDWRTLSVIDVATGAKLADEVRWVKFSSLSWNQQGTGFFYSRFPEPEKKAEFQSLNTNQAVYFHALGTPQSADQLIYATPKMPKRSHAAQVTDDGAYLVVTTSEGTDDRFELHVAKLDDKPVKLRPLIVGLEHSWEMAGSVGSKFYFVTNRGAPRGQLVMMDVKRPSAPLKAMVPESRDTLVGASLVGERIILAYLGDAKSEAELRLFDGRTVGSVTLPGIGTAAGFGGQAGDSETFYSFSSYTTPSTIYRFDTATGKSEIWEKPKIAFDPANFETQQVFFPSKDGTRVPMFIVRNKGAASGPAPALLYGYGGFNSSQTPAFSASRIAWIEQGGVLAIANLRGGGEYGKAWHDAGRLANKQNVFDDFIAAGEYLVAQGITSKGKLAIEGRSNGGLLVGAVVNQRPDLFAVAIPTVGVMDMLRFNRFTAGRYWVDDYGDPNVEADFRVLRAYSPYHNVRGGEDYPAILVTTADTDDRVVPGHSFKYTAALQAAAIGSKPHLIRIETRAGHGSGKPTDKIIAESADIWAFVAKWTGMEVKAR